MFTGGPGFRASATEKVSTFFFAIYTLSGEFKPNSQIGSVIGANKVFLKLHTDTKGDFEAIGMADYGVTGTNESQLAAPAPGWQMDAWNTIELSCRLNASEGGAEIWVNGEKLADNGYRFDTSSLSVDKVEIGNTAYAHGLIDGGSFISTTLTFPPFRSWRNAMRSAIRTSGRQPLPKTPRRCS